MAPEAYAAIASCTDRWRPDEAGPGPPLAPRAGCGVTGQATVPVPVHPGMGCDLWKAPITRPQCPLLWRRAAGLRIAQDVAALNVAFLRPRHPRHWEERTGPSWWPMPAADPDRAASPATRHPQGARASWPIPDPPRSGYRHLQAGGWRSLSAEAGAILPRFDQWKPAQQRPGSDGRARSIKYEPRRPSPDAAGCCCPRCPSAAWQLICERQGLGPALMPPPRRRVLAGPWATPDLQLLICEGWEKGPRPPFHRPWPPSPCLGFQMGPPGGCRCSERLIEALLAAGPWPPAGWNAFDAGSKPSPPPRSGRLADLAPWPVPFRAAGGLGSDPPACPLLSGAEQNRPR